MGESYFMKICGQGKRSLWKKETELQNEIDRLDSEMVKVAQKNLDVAQPGVSFLSVCYSEMYMMHMFYFI